MKQSNNDENTLIENWIIFLTCEFNEIEIKEIICKEINKKIFKEKRANDNLIIIFYENINDQYILKLKNWINFNKSDVLLKDQLDKLRDIMGTKGEKHKTHFELEKYKNKF